MFGTKNHLKNNHPTTKTMQKGRNTIVLSKSKFSPTSPQVTSQRLRVLEYGLMRMLNIRKINQMILLESNLHHQYILI